MGFAKYHEDNLHIMEERMYYRNTPDTLSIVRSTYKPNKPTYSVYCPLCRCGLTSTKALTDHIFNAHGKRYEFIYLNSSQLSESQYNVSKIYSLKMYCFYDKPQHITITDDFDRKYFIDTSKDKYEYDVTTALKGKLFSYLKIELPNGKETIEIQQFLDMKAASIDNILHNRYVSSLFDVRISDDSLSISECLTYMKMLIHEKTEVDSFILRVENIHFDFNRELVELYWYYFLATNKFEENNQYEKETKVDIFHIFFNLLNGNFSDMEKRINNVSRNDNDAIGCRLLYAIITHDEMSIAYNMKEYKPYGILGMLVNSLIYISRYEDDIRMDISNDLKEISLFAEYPLVSALLEFDKAERGEADLSKQSYDLLKESGAIVAVLYCKSIKDPYVVEKILKSNVRIHSRSKMLKGIALDQDFAWISNRISVKDGEVYRRKLEAENKKRTKPFTEEFLDVFPYDNDISVTALGGEEGIGASCFILSYNGYNIMIDAGLNPRKRDDAAYPELDSWEGNIDLILLSHAHIDHSGGIPKAHAMWKDARIMMTKPTKVLLKYIYSDMARVKNGIVDDFEIENVNITKEVMEDTFRAISTIDYQDKIKVGEDIEICFHKAGHIVGAAMIELNIAGKSILYTGDYTDYDQSFVSGANYDELPQKVDYLLTEATYIAKSEFDRYEQGEDIKRKMHDCIERKQSVLLPAASIGRSQEIVCILGEMLEKGEIPSEYNLYLAGMAIPTTTQLIPFFNEVYENLLARFIEFDGVLYPEEMSIVVASSGTLKKGSASYKIEQYWKKYGIRHLTIMGGYSDEDTEYEYDEWGNTDRCRMPLSTHVSRDGIYKLICKVEPKVVSVVHRGTKTKSELDLLERKCEKAFNNDILFMDLCRNKKVNTFNLLEHVMEENSDGR